MTQKPNEERREELTAYLDGEVPADVADKIERDLSTDDNTRRELDSLQRAWDLLDALPMPKTLPQFSQKTVALASQLIDQQRVEKRSQRVPPDWVWGSLAVAAFALSFWVVIAKPPRHERLLAERDLLLRLDHYRAANNIEFLRKIDQDLLLHQMDEIMEDQP